MKQKIIVTALPNGKAVNKNPGAFKISAAISLQVEDVNDKLNHVPDMLNWASLIKGAKFMVQYNGGSVEAKVTSTIDSGLWNNLFMPTVDVKSFVPEPLHNLPLASYPAKHVVEYIKAITEQLGKNFSNDLPDSNFYTSNPILKAVTDYDVPQLPKEQGREKLTRDSFVIKIDRQKRYLSSLYDRKYIPFAPTANPEVDFTQLKNFHGLYKKPVEKFVQVPKPDFEFHDILAILSNYPQLMRKLGLVIDFEIPAQAIGDGTLRIIPFNLNFTAPTTWVCPPTACTATANGFYAKAASGSFIDKGFVKINSDAFTVFQVDADGAALKLGQMMDGLMLKKATHLFYAYDNKIKNENLIPLLNNEAPKKEGTPSLRTAGIAIAKNGLAETMNKKFSSTYALVSKILINTSLPAGLTGTNASWIASSETLYADDINFGYRMDIQPEDKPGNWYSLHKRSSKYSFINSAKLNIDINGIEPDEGFIQPAVAQEDNGTTKQLKVGEVIARWEGWSMSAPRPGSALNDPMLDAKPMYDKSKGEEKAENAKYRTPVDEDFKLNVIDKVMPGTLPMLRFGKKYSIKIRTVDLAGNSVASEFIPENTSDCIKPPLKYFRFEPVDAPFLVLGNAVNDGESAQTLVIRSNEGVSSTQYEKNNSTGFSGITVRHVMPPRCTVEMAITHGMMDHGMGNKNSSNAQSIYDKIKNDKDPSVTNADDMSQMKVFPGKNGDLKVEYLVDPMAMGVSFFLSNDDPNPKILNPSILDRWVSFYFDDPLPSTKVNDPISYEQWMNPKVFSIKLQEADTPNIDWEQSTRTLKVSLQKGVIVKMCYASFWRTKDIENLNGVYDFMNPPTIADAVKQRIGKGQHWMFSPWREMTFVHAVQQPIVKANGAMYPQIVKIEPDRNYGDDFATLNSKLLVHGPSSSQLDIEAGYTDWVDDVSKALKRNNDDLLKVPVRSKVFHYTVPYLVFENVFGALVKGNPFPGITHALHDTKYRTINYKAIATTRYRENFYHLINAKGDSFKLTSESAELKDIKILSSARPAAPDIAYIIPTFEWSEAQKGNTKLRGRASGLRIYIKRPWFSSGEGEQLAVVLGYPGMPSIGSNPSQGVPYSSWGSDPTKLSAYITAPGQYSTLITQDHFINVKAENKVAELTAKENEGSKVMIVAYDVNTAKFDEERQLYYVDVMLNIGAAYFPFVKLALARYQRNALRKDNKDCCLSPIVQADYVQVPAPRATSLEFKNGSKTNIVAAMSGTMPNVSGTTTMFGMRIDFIIEPIEVDSSEQAHISINAKPIDSFSYQLNQNDIKNFALYQSHEFNLPAQYASQPYRVKIMEYELIERDRLKPRPAGEPNLGGMPTNERLVFADVYEVNK